MITQSSIDKILNEVDLVATIGRKVDLKKGGATYSGCCPFHNEKTPSFVVSPSKGIYKCFGCGAGGNVISFVMEYERLDFVEAVRLLAKDNSITLEETAEREDKEITDKRKTMLDMNRSALKRYQEAFYSLPATHWAVETVINERRLTNDSIIGFQLGYAPDKWDFLSKKIVDAGLYGFGEELGLINKSDGGRVYDVMRDRIIFPIHNERGEIIAFSGRKRNDDNKSNPKYINSKDSLVYRKSDVLYGLWQAQREIRKRDHAILVEGNVDVIMMHQAGVTNTVAACGTAFTESHAQKLARYCNRVTVIMDGDDAGRKATLKAIDILLMAELSVYVVELDEGWDPDTMVQCEYEECCGTRVLTK